MGDNRISETVLREVMNAFEKLNGNTTAAAKSLGISRDTFRGRLATAKLAGIKTGELDFDDVAHLKNQLKRVENELKNAQKDRLDHMTIKRHIVGLTRAIDEVVVPTWAIKTDLTHADFGVPTLMLSDLHWGEVVDPKQIGGVNTYNMSIADKRLKKVAEGALRLLSILSPKLDYPGIVVPLGGDMISGNIHDELMATNEMNTMPTVLDLYGKLVWLIRFFADKFGKVFLPCVTGNHGRDTRKIWGKDRHATSFDWLLYCLLAKHFENDDRITFLIPDGSDAFYKIYNHRFLMSHGDQFRGGDGVIGVLGPVIRGDYKKRSRNSQIGLEYDTMILGHFHQHIQLTKLIINGSLKGYDEFAYSNNFSYERPQQALWITHPKHGITYRMPVYVDTEANVIENRNWVSVEK